MKRTRQNPKKRTIRIAHKQPHTRMHPRKRRRISPARNLPRKQAGKLSRTATMHYRKKRIPSSLPNLLLIAGIVLLIIWGIHKVIYFRSLSLSERIIAAYAVDHGTGVTPNYIRIGKTIRVQVVEAGFINGSWSIAPDAANHVPQSGTPGEPRNIIIYAHNKATLFGPLMQVTAGDQVSVLNSDGKTYDYRVTEVTEVDPTDTTLLRPTGTEVLTIYTCSGIFDSRRFVVRAVPLNYQ